MTRHSEDFVRARATGRAVPHRFDDPLEAIHADHMRQREICALLDRVAQPGGPEAASVRAALGFMFDDLPLHLEDEERDLFPRLRTRCEPGDELAPTLDRLAAEHRSFVAEAPAIAAILEALCDGCGGISGGERAFLGAFVGRSRRHLTFENAIVLPFARLRLLPEDREAIRLGMMRRRGLAACGEAAP
ncbi:hemerythrin domain-containing protein [Roseicyclus sp.]|uniref:hemerythrin domain-containing protein n=1 Tax=Roseicyclus sp. TaxID=1914329 RepID=UPI003FA111B2